jgi:tRNA-dihydrouridine synthase A
MIDRRISIAPMMDWTDRFQRYFMRLITRHALLYTEMIHANAVTHGDRKKLLAYDASEHPLAVQLGGSDPQQLSEASQIVADFGYDEINLNVGCPSDRVQAGRFGACLMAEPELVADCLAAMQAKVNIPVTIKCRIGIDKADQYEYLKNFVSTVINNSDCKIFIIHARSAWLKGLSPKENRTVPPLRYEYVYQLKQEFPHLTICLNGGIKDHTDIKTHLEKIDGVMLGREAYHNPYFLASIDQAYYASEAPIPTREEILAAYEPFIQQQIESGISRKQITRHILGLYHGQPGGKLWRKQLSEAEKCSSISL